MNRLEAASFLILGLLPIASQGDNKGVLFSVTSINRFARSTTDFDEVDDVRNFTSEALFSESEDRLNRPLTRDELRTIARSRDQFETFNNISLRLPDEWLVDLFYKYRDIDNSQITDFSNPEEFNDVDLNEYGVAVQRYFFDKPLFLRGTYKRTLLDGTVEFFPKSRQDINHYEINTAISIPFSGYLAVVYPTYVYQDIDQDIPDPYGRERQIYAFTFAIKEQPTQQHVTVGSPADRVINSPRSGSPPEGFVKPLLIFQDYLTVKDPRPLSAIENIFARRFDTRGWKLYGGAVYDEETFGNTDVRRYDFFIGTSFSKPFGFDSIDFTLQPGVFTSDVDGDSSQDNAQYRTDVILFYQVKESLLFLIPLRHDVAIEGPDDFENWKVGAELDYKWDNAISVSLRYDYQRFYSLDKGLNLFNINFSMEF